MDSCGAHYCDAVQEKISQQLSRLENLRYFPMTLSVSVTECSFELPQCDGKDLEST